ncbi:hypothetical protein D3C85_1887400 [compost metagenome]
MSTMLPTYSEPGLDITRMRVLWPLPGSVMTSGRENSKSVSLIGKGSCGLPSLIRSTTICLVVLL